MLKAHETDKLPSTHVKHSHNCHGFTLPRNGARGGLYFLLPLTRG